MAETAADLQEQPNEEIEQGAYELLKARLETQARELKTRVDSLNEDRAELFGGREISVLGTERIRTEHNCIPQDIAAVNGFLLFGYNAEMAMKTLTPGDLFCLHRFEAQEGSFSFPPLEKTDERNFFRDPKFRTAFETLVRYQKKLELRMLRIQGNRLLAQMQTGDAAGDRKTLQWAIGREGQIEFLDDKGEVAYPPTHDFEWTATTRADHVSGSHPHVNINNKLFVECVGGDLTVKLEDNTEDGLGIYREDVDQPNQALHDAQIFYYDAEELILLKILPYRENQWRYLVYNTRDKSVHRVDAIGLSCIQLPESHGIIFPGGYYLLEGALRQFEGEFEGMLLARAPLASPNGEDVLYVFRNPESGEAILLSYNLVSREMSTPIRCHGFSLFDDGLMVIFRSDENQEPSKVHPLQIWQTPFMTAENYELAPRSGSHLEKIGNAELVRGVSDCLSIARRIREQTPSTLTYGDLIRSVTRAIDTHHWLDHSEVGSIASVLKEVRATSELVLQEFDKVEKLRKQATQELETIEGEMNQLLRTLRSDDWEELDPYVSGLDKLRSLRGRTLTAMEARYAETERLKAAEKALVERFDSLSESAVNFLLDQDAFGPYRERITGVEASLGEVQKATEVAPLSEELSQVGKGLEILQEILATLKVEDPTLRTRILEQISEVTSLLNRVRAMVANKRQQLGEQESVAEFGVQFKLFSQNAQSALSLADTPEKVDESLSSLLLNLEELEAKFGEFDAFLGDLYEKREEIISSFSSKKQVLSDQRQRRIDQLVSAADRVLEGIVRRATALKDNEALNTFFSSDPMVMKVRELSDKLREQSDDVRAEELLARLKNARQESTRGLRDRQELFEDGENVVRLGRHRFSLNTEPLGLSLVPRNEGMAYHVTGTDFYEQVSDAAFQATKAFWNQEYVSETQDVYRGEYLAYCLFDDVLAERWKEVTLKDLIEAHLEGRERVLGYVREYASERYDEGYDRGVHDEDAATVLGVVLGLYRTSGLLRYSAHARSAAVLTWTFGLDPSEQKTWQHQAQSLGLMAAVFPGQGHSRVFKQEIAERILAFCARKNFELSEPDADQAAEYLIAELGSEPLRFVTSGDAARVKTGFLNSLERSHNVDVFRSHLEGLTGQVQRQYDLCQTWIRSFVESLGRGKERSLARALLVQEEAAVLLMTDQKLDREVSSGSTHGKAEGLLGQHPSIKNGVLEIRLDEFLGRLSAYRAYHVPAYREYQKTRHALLEEEKHRLRLDEYSPKVMSAFVRNRLINEVYLPLIGDNLAKQMGSVGADKRTDQMGMLLLISPPGYGKTTLMEYVASRLGLIFVKVNGPALGHSVTSLDPSEANNATAAQEVEKVNFGLEMGNNVMLYLDDIQHCDPEFLQKFISLCDGQRRIEGVWRGRTRTYDLKGKRFCIIMAGNPYTETGTRFQIPDMLANRADTYNLGDILSGRQEAFEQSYIENALTSNPTLAPLAGREQSDLYKFIQIAEGTPIPLSEMKHNYSAAEGDEIVTVLKKLLVVQRTVLRVNQEYIRSASTDDKYRTEPPFKLQGSYRNMCKMAERVVPVMNDQELEALVVDHYVGESQTLTSGAEQNLLKLGELRGTLTPEQQERWNEIKRGFARNMLAGGDENDPVLKVTNVLAVVSQRLEDIQRSIATAGEKTERGEEPLQAVLPAEFGQYLSGLQNALARLAERPETAPAPTAPPEFTRYLQGLQEALQTLAERPVAAPAPPAQDLSPYLKGLEEALAKLADRPVQVQATGISGPPMAVPPTAPASSTGNPFLDPDPFPGVPTVGAVPSVGPAPARAGELPEIRQHVVPALRQVAELIRGPNSKTILMDGKLVEAFDALREAETLEDVLAALKPLRSR